MLLICSHNFSSHLLRTSLLPNLPPLLVLTSGMIDYTSQCVVLWKLLGSCRYPREHLKPWSPWDTTHLERPEENGQDDSRKSGHNWNFRSFLISSSWEQENSVILLLQRQCWGLWLLCYIMWEQITWDLSSKVRISRKKMFIVWPVVLRIYQKIGLIKIPITENQMLYWCCSRGHSFLPFEDEKILFWVWAKDN